MDGAASRPPVDFPFHGARGAGACREAGNLEGLNGFMRSDTGGGVGRLPVSNSSHDQSPHLFIFSDASEQNACCANVFLSGERGMGAWHIVRFDPISSCPSLRLQHKHKP